MKDKALNEAEVTLFEILDAMQDSAYELENISRQADASKQRIQDSVNELWSLLRKTRIQGGAQ